MIAANAQASCAPLARHSELKESSLILKTDLVVEGTAVSVKEQATTEGNAEAMGLEYNFRTVFYFCGTSGSDATLVRALGAAIHSIR